MQRLLFLIGVAALANCSPPNQPAPQDTTSAATDTAPTDADGSAVFGAVPDKPVFELGTNITGKSTPEYYKALPEGAEINVELGPQGLWMVVLAFRTKNLLKPPMVLGGRVELEGALLLELDVLGRRVFFFFPFSLFIFFWSAFCSRLTGVKFKGGLSFRRFFFGPSIIPTGVATIY